VAVHHYRRRSENPFSKGEWRSGGDNSKTHSWQNSGKVAGSDNDAGKKVFKARILMSNVG